MSLEDDDITPLSDSLGAEYFKNKEIVGESQFGDATEYYAEFTDLLCKKCECGLHIIQLNTDNSVLKIICSRCGSEEEIDICNGCNQIENS